MAQLIKAYQVNTDECSTGSNSGGHHAFQKLLLIEYV